MTVHMRTVVSTSSVVPVRPDCTTDCAIALGAMVVAHSSKAAMRAVWAGQTVDVKRSHLNCEYHQSMHVQDILIDVLGVGCIPEDRMAKCCRVVDARQWIKGGDAALDC